MYNFGLKFGALLLCMSLSILLPAQVEFHAKTEVKEVVVGAVFQVEYVLQNANGSGFKPPEFRGFDVISGPSTSQSTTIINGRRSSYISYGYMLHAKQEGSFVIPSAIIYVGNKEYRSNMLTIRVVKAIEEKEGKDLPKAYVKVQLDTNKFYVGQQIIVTLKLFTSIDIMNYDVRFDPVLQDMSKMMIPIPRRERQIEVIDGVQYSTYIIRKMAFFPQRTGPYEIPRAFVSLGIRSRNRRRTSFFFDSPDKQLNMFTQSVPIEVVPLPPDPPASFNGAIGHYSVRFRIDKRRLDTDQALSLTMDIQGDGDIKIIEAPELFFGSDLEVFEPKLKSENKIMNGDKIRFKKQYEYLITPNKTGNFKFRPTFSYFDTDSLQFITLGNDTFRIDVRQGAHTGIKGSGIDPNRSPRIEALITDISLKKPLPLFFESKWYWLSIFLMGIALLGGWMKYKRKQKDAAMDPLVRKRLLAAKLAHNHLQKAKSIMDQQDMEFYKAIQSGILGYISDKLNLRTTELSKSNVQKVLMEHKMDEMLIKDTMNIIHTCETALYASFYKADKNELYQKSVQLIEGFEMGLDEIA